MVRRLDLPIDEIVEAYVRDGLPVSRIAEAHGCSDGVIVERLVEAGVRRPRATAEQVDVIHRRYHQDGGSVVEIARALGLDPRAVRNALRAHGGHLRNAPLTSEALPCPRSASFRAWALGFAWGDLKVTEQGSGTVSVSCGTTKQAQIDAIVSTFEPFGRCSITGSDRRHVRVLLDSSFHFLTEKDADRVPPWIDSSPVVAASFAAGYVDAEGSFGVYDRRARFKLDAYDEAVVGWLSEWCRGIGVEAKHTRIAAKGSPRSAASPYPADLWRLSVNEALSLLRFVVTLRPLSRHSDRIEQMRQVVVNVESRLSERAWINRSSGP